MPKENKILYNNQKKEIKPVRNDDNGIADCPQNS
jgi:hypothetical protein